MHFRIISKFLIILSDISNYSRHHILQAFGVSSDSPIRKQKKNAFYRRFLQDLMKSICACGNIDGMFPLQNARQM